MLAVVWIYKHCAAVQEPVPEGFATENVRKTTQGYPLEKILPRTAGTMVLKFLYELTDCIIPATLAETFIIIYIQQAVKKICSGFSRRQEDSGTASRRGYKTMVAMLCVSQAMTAAAVLT
jgi:hypothetical protein